MEMHYNYRSITIGASVYQPDNSGNLTVKTVTETRSLILHYCTGPFCLYSVTLVYLAHIYHHTKWALSASRGLKMTKWALSASHGLKMAKWALSASHGLKTTKWALLASRVLTPTRSSFGLSTIAVRFISHTHSQVPRHAPLSPLQIFPPRPSLHSQIHQKTGSYFIYIYKSQTMEYETRAGFWLD